MRNLYHATNGEGGCRLRPCGGPSTACLACRSRAKAARYAPTPRPSARSALPQHFAPPSPPASPSRDAIRKGGFSRGFYGLWHLTTAIERAWVRNLPAPDAHHRPALGAARQERLEGIRQVVKVNGSCDLVQVPRMEITALCEP